LVVRVVEVPVREVPQQSLPQWLALTAQADRVIAAVMEIALNTMQLVVVVQVVLEVQQLPPAVVTVEQDRPHS
jgi:hypothetical protein